MVRTDQMWRYTGTVKLGHHHDGDVDGPLTWETLTAVKPSEAQGWDFWLECGCKLQSCFDDMDIEVQVIWHEDVLNWHSQP
jgi:hypothetical protein